MHAFSGYLELRFTVGTRLARSVGEVAPATISGSSNSAKILHSFNSLSTLSSSFYFFFDVSEKTRWRWWVFKAKYLGPLEMTLGLVECQMGLSLGHDNSPPLIKNSTPNSSHQTLQ